MALYPYPYPYSWPILASDPYPYPYSWLGTRTRTRTHGLGPVPIPVLMAWDPYPYSWRVPILQVCLLPITGRHIPVRYKVECPTQGMDSDRVRTRTGLESGLESYFCWTRTWLGLGTPGLGLESGLGHKRTRTWLGLGFNWTRLGSDSDELDSGTSLVLVR